MEKTLMTNNVTTDKRFSATLEAENENSAADGNPATLDDTIARTIEMNDRLITQLRGNEPWRYSDNKFKRGCSRVWRGIKWWVNQVLSGGFYTAAGCLVMLMVHWVAQAGGIIAGLFS